MLIRRHFLTATAGLVLAQGFRPARAADADPRLGDRALGNADAPVTVVEYFSLTCTHCAAFAKEVFPQVKTALIDTGKLRYVFRDYPLDQVALLAAMVARSLPADRYEPFMLALFSTQDRWAFARDANPSDEIARMAALAGMPRATFDAVAKDDALKKAIVAQQDAATKTYSIDSTPTFLFSGGKAKDVKHTGEMTYDAFAKAVADAG